MNQYFKVSKCFTTTIGNHQFNYGEDYLLDKITK